MATFTTEIRIEARMQDVWEVLANIGDIYAWNPGVRASHLTTDKAEGVGAGRHCDLGGKDYLDETVVEWEPGRKLTMRIKGTNLPFKSADIHFTLRPNGPATIVSVSPNYTLKFGVLGAILDRFYVRRTYLKGMNALLKGLKAQVEKENSDAV